MTFIEFKMRLLWANTLVLAVLWPSLTHAANTRPATDWTGLEVGTNRHQQPALGLEPDTNQDQLAFIELKASDGPFYAGQVFDLKLVFGIELALEKRGLQQLYQREFDLPVQIDWHLGASALDMDAESDFTLRESEPSSPQNSANQRSMVLNTLPTRCTAVGVRTHLGHAYQTFECRFRLQAKHAGELDLGTPSLRFAFASQYRADVLGRAVAIDRVEARVLGPRLSRSVLPLPEANRPPEFTGAIGHFAISTDFGQRVVDEGDHFQLRLRIQGNGNMESFTAPRFDWPGFHLLGSRELLSENWRELRYDLQPMSTGELEIKDLRFVYFDPTPPGRYRSIELQPILLRVRPDPNASPVALETDEEQSSDGQTHPYVYVIGVGALVLLAAGLASRLGSASPPTAR